MALESEPSVIPGIFLSDGSIVEQGTQKRSLIGCFDRFSFSQFPAQYGRFFITFWITNAEGTVTQLEITTRIQEKGSGHVVLSNSTKIEFGEEKRMARDDIMALSLGVPTVTFGSPGVYTVLLLINGEEAGSRDFKVIQESK